MYVYEYMYMYATYMYIYIHTYTSAFNEIIVILVLQPREICNL